MRSAIHRAVGSVFLAFALVLASGCDKSSNPTSSGPSGSGAISYSGFVNPTFNIYGCPSCHGGSGGLTLTTYQGLLAGGVDGAVVIPGNGAGSLIIQKLRGTSSIGAQMPLGGTPLPSSTIDSISLWIDQGAINN